jgi:hypothetical protein
MIAMTTEPTRAGKPDAGIRRATGRGYDEWFARLDEWGAPGRPYREIAAWLTGSEGLSDWWAQKLIVEFEQARGIRKPGARPDGTFTAGASKTVVAEPQAVFEAVVDPALRIRWLPDAELAVRATRPPRKARFDLPDGTRISVEIQPASDGRSLVAVEQQRLPDAESAATARAAWRDRLEALKATLEG